MDVDELTKVALVEHFLYSRICSLNVERWRWMFKRNMRLYYPMYQQELSMWEEYRKLEWFYDKEKVNQKLHEEISTVDETTKDVLDLTDVTNRTQDTAGSGDSSGTGESSSHQDESGTSHSDDTTDTTVTGKSRAFSFNYPEANYQAGVIPYDLDNNPDVEFISTQGDTVNKSDTHTTGQSDSRYSGEQDNTSNSSYNDRWSSTGNLTGKDDKKTDSTKDGKRDSTNTLYYHDRYDYDGNNIVDLADKLNELLQATNFWKRFVDRMEICFDMTFDDGRVWEDRRYEY